MTRRGSLIGIGVVIALVVGCGTTDAPGASPTVTSGPSPPLSSATFVPAHVTCSLFTPPPYDALVAVPGISIRVVDKLHFEIINATDRDYYYKVFLWTTEDNLVCGSGVLGNDVVGGPVAARQTEGVGEGSTVDVPVTVAIWDKPCGEQCSRPPIGEFVVPISAVAPVRTNL